MKNLIICFLLTLFLLSFTVCGKAPNENENAISIKTYRDIPGITEKEIAAIEAIKSTHTSISYGQLLESESFVLPDGTDAGFAVKFCDLLSNLFGIKFNLEITDWDSLITKLDKRQIDFTGDLTPTPERLRFYYMTQPIAERSQRIFTTSGKRLLTERDINGQKVGFLRGTIDANAVHEYYPDLSFTVVDIASFDSAANMLKSGEIDAFVTEGVLDPLFDEYGYIQSREFFPLVYTPVSLTTANPELEPIISVVNKYLSAGGIELLFEYYHEGNDEYTRSKLRKTFTEEEKAYIDKLATSGGSVKIGLEHDNYPFSFYNKADNEFQGIAVDVLSEISKLSGIKFEIANNETNTWAEIFEMLKSGKVSLVSQLLYSDERRGLFLWTDHPYASAYYALISKANFPNLAIYQVASKKVGTISKSAFEDKYNQWFPEHNNTISYNTQNEALDALETGKIDLMMGSEYMLLFEQNYREKPGYKINIRFGIPMDSYFGINKNEEVLCSIINKSQTLVKTDIISDEWANRGYDYVKEMARQRLRFLLLIAAVLSVVLILTMIFLFRHKKLNRNLDRTVKERTRDLEHQTQAAQVASKAKSVFLATMSHELRTPLNAIIGMAGIAKNSISNREKALSSIDQILNSSSQLLGLLNNVLDMSKIEAGKLELCNEPFNSKEAYTEVCEIIGQRCTDKNIKFNNVKDKIKDLTLFGDRQRVNQILINLLGNAVKFTPEGGEVTFTATILEEDDESIKYHFVVADTGIGMTEEQMHKLFIPFEQVDSGVAAKFGGTGLGLSISQNLVSMMGGIITVKSTLNAGSEFCFDLGFNKVTDIIEQEPAIELADLCGKKILLVDDIEINRMVVTELLTPIGIEIEEAENGKQALEKFSDSPPNYYDFIFMDVQMPVMGGYEAARQIRSLDRPDARKIPIIAMTANAFKEDIEEALSSGMNEHIPKPIDIENVINTLMKFI